MLTNLISQTNTQDSDLACKVCEQCGEPLEHIINFLGNAKKVPIACKCAVEKYNANLLRAENMDKIRKLDSLKKISLMDSSFEKCTFSNWELDENNKGLYELGKRYCENWTQMKRDNVGMLFYGSPGTGKSFISFCIANELLSQYIPVIATSSINIINKIYESYKSFGEDGEIEIINQINSASLVVIDDLGAEHDGRTGKEKQIIYSLIDARIRAQLPLIITTNLTQEQLKKKLTGSDGVCRTYDRIVEACAMIEVKGSSRRIAKAMKKQEIIRGLVS